MLCEVFTAVVPLRGPRRAIEALWASIYSRGVISYKPPLGVYKIEAHPSGVEHLKVFYVRTALLCVRRTIEALWASIVMGVLCEVCTRTANNSPSGYYFTAKDRTPLRGVMLYEVRTHSTARTV